MPPAPLHLLAALGACSHSCFLTVASFKSSGEAVLTKILTWEVDFSQLGDVRPGPGLWRSDLHPDPSGTPAGNLQPFYS